MTFFSDPMQSSLITSESTPDTGNGKPVTPIAAASDWKYEASVAEIETIIARIEAGELELAEVFEQFEVAVNHLRQCEAFLAQRQQQMDLLIEILMDDSGF